MATSSTVTDKQQRANRAVSKSKSRRTALDAQPLPRKNLKSDTAADRKNEERQLALADGDRVVNWLNAAQGTESEQRVVSVRNELVTLPSDWAMHNMRGPWAHPDLRKGFDEAHRLLVQRHHMLNESLSSYAFRPRVTHLEPGGGWVFGIVPDENKRWFTTRIGAGTISEADAVMCLLRLASTRDLSKVRQCETCRDRWLFAAKRNHRFCSAVCRELFYAKAPDYHARKAKNQRVYRQALKQAKANFIA
jgi:hypothetical protein